MIGLVSLVLGCLVFFFFSHNVAYHVTITSYNEDSHEPEACSACNSIC